jgi:serine/threonine protein kinase
MAANPEEGNEEPDDLQIEDLVAQAMELVEGTRLDELEKLLAEHPEHASRVRERLSALERLGLLHPSPAERIPERLGRYHIVSKLGEGGMSVVYLARDEVLDRPVALKVARAPLAGGERARERFRREVRAASSVRHPCLVPIHDAGEEDGRPWLAMEHIEGATLAEVVDRLRALGRPPGTLESADFARAVGSTGPGERGSAWGRTYVESVCRIVVDVADAMQALHDAGILHRDVKPANILVRPDGRALLFDLGLAHLDELPALTRTGEFAGTPAYVAPEQVVHGAAKAEVASDVYSLGVTLYELLTLRRPFEAASAVELWRSITRDEPPLPRRFHASLARDLETICLATLEKDPRRRFASASAFAADLRRFLEYRRVEARPVGALRRGMRILRRDPSLAAAVVLAIAIFLALPIGLLLHTAAIRDERDIANFQRGVGQEVLEFLIDLGREVGQDRSGGEGAALARGFLDRGVERLTLEFGDKIYLRAALMEALGRMYASLRVGGAFPLLTARSRWWSGPDRNEHRDREPDGELRACTLESGNAAAASRSASARSIRRYGRAERFEEATAPRWSGRAALGLGELDRAETLLLALTSVRAREQAATWKPRPRGVLAESQAGRSPWASRTRGELRAAMGSASRGVASAIEDLGEPGGRGGIARATALNQASASGRPTPGTRRPRADGLPCSSSPAWLPSYSRASSRLTALRRGRRGASWISALSRMEPRARYARPTAQRCAGRARQRLWHFRAEDRSVFTHGPRDPGGGLIDWSCCGAVPRQC